MSDLQETFEFEMKLAALTLKNWQKKPTGIKQSKAALSRINEKRELLIGTEYDSLYLEIRRLIVDLHTQFTARSKFMWQYEARKLGIPIEQEADDKCECTLCGTPTPLTMVKLCVPCYRIKRAIQENPEVARKILEQLK